MSIAQKISPWLSTCDLETLNPSVYLKIAAFKDEEKDAKALRVYL